MAERYTPFYEWVARQQDLTVLEKLIVCRVLRWGEAGCWESNVTLSNVLGFDRTNIIRSIKTLAKKGWVLFTHDNRQRVMYISDEKLVAGPLWNSGAAQPLKDKRVAQRNHQSAKGLQQNSQVIHKNTEVIHKGVALRSKDGHCAAKMGIAPPYYIFKENEREKEKVMSVKSLKEKANKALAPKTKTYRPLTPADRATEAKRQKQSLLNQIDSIKK